MIDRGLVCYNLLMKNNLKYDTRNFYGQARLRDGRYEITGEALLLALLLHSTGEGRDSEDFKDLQRIMGDINLQEQK